MTTPGRLRLTVVYEYEVTPGQGGYEDCETLDQCRDVDGEAIQCSDEALMGLLQQGEETLPEGLPYTLEVVS